jgi:hypothetical protein
MVVKIAGTDIDFVGDLIGRGPGLAVLVEQQQAGNEDAVTGIASHPRTMGQKCS